MEIHQIATGRGNAAFAILPDGTTLLVDAGDVGDVAGLSAHPDNSRPASEWIARYIRRVVGDREPRIDYAVLTHYHADHIGGISHVAKQIPIGTILDRGSAYLPPPGSDRTFSAYRDFITASGVRREPAAAGSSGQIVLRSRDQFPFEARVISANDRVWTGRGDETRVRFPEADSLPAEDRPTENMCSVTLKLSHGDFDYFTGGDQPGYPNPGAPAWHDLETEVAKAVGETDVHVVDHHWLHRVLRGRTIQLPRASIRFKNLWLFVSNLYITYI